MVETRANAVSPIGGIVILSITGTDTRLPSNSKADRAQPLRLKALVKRFCNCFGEDSPRKASYSTACGDSFGLAMFGFNTGNQGFKIGFYGKLILPIAQKLHIDNSRADFMGAGHFVPKAAAIATIAVSQEIVGATDCSKVQLPIILFHHMTHTAP